ncbi:MAG: hypothetical protein AABX74_04905 [Nanoarchaeota archaeon]
MEQNASFRNNAKLSLRVSTLMAKLQETNDPRYQEILSVYRQAEKSHPSYKGINLVPDTNFEPTFAAVEAVFDYTERNHRDLYQIIQTSHSNV